MIYDHRLKEDKRDDSSGRLPDPFSLSDADVEMEALPQTGSLKPVSSSMLESTSFKLRVTALNISGSDTGSRSDYGSGTEVIDLGQYAFARIKTVIASEWRYI